MKESNSTQDFHILCCAGDGIGPDILHEAQRVLQFFQDHQKLDCTVYDAVIGGAAVDQHGVPLPEETLTKAQECHAVLLGAVGGPKWDALPTAKKPESGLLQIRKGLGLFGNIRPARVFSGLEDASALKFEIVQGIDLVIVRELIGGIYFGQPRGTNEMNEVFNTMVYTQSEIERIAHLAFRTAEKRQKKCTSVDKANVLEVSQLWRKTVTDLHAKQYAHIELEHMYIDNCAMQLIQNPKQFDVILTSNLFGDILSDEAATLTGSIGLLPSASLGQDEQTCKGLFEPVHGSAPDLAGKHVANPMAMLLSLALCFRYADPDPERGHDLATSLESAIEKVIAQGWRTQDLATSKTPKPKVCTTSEITDQVIAQLKGM